MVAKEQDNFAKIAELMSERKRLAQELTDIEVELYSLHRLEGLPYVSVGGKVQPRVAKVKARQHAEGRAEAAKLGVPYSELRSRKTAKRLGLGTVEQLQKFRLEQQAAATKAGLSLTAWRQGEADRLNTSFNNVEKELASAWTNTRLLDTGRREPLTNR
jgi:hypothetical protein